MPQNHVHVRLERAQEVLDRVETAERRRDELGKNIERLESELANAEKNERRAQEALASWQSSWEETTRPLVTLGVATPEEAVVVLDKTDEMFGKLKEARELQDRIGGIERDAKDFARKVAEMCARVAADLASVPVEQSAAALNARLTRSRLQKAKLDELTK